MPLVMQLFGVAENLMDKFGGKKTKTVDFKCFVKQKRMLTHLRNGSKDRY